MDWGKRKADRVRFDHKHAATLVGVDGTWRRSCVLVDVSDTGAKLQIDGSTEVLKAREFFLLLSSTGLAFRRCELVWIDGSNAGVRFVKAKPPHRKAESGREEKQVRFRRCPPAPAGPVSEGIRADPRSRRRRRSRQADFGPQAARTEVSGH